MSAKANPKKIGMFVVGAIVFLVAGVAVFGGGKVFQKTITYVAFFQGSVAGLAVGSPVTLQGVPIGSVTDIQVEYNVADLDSRIPVYFQITPEKVRVVGADNAASFSTEAIHSRIKKLVDKGLRAQLTSVSLVTGQLAIQLSLQPNTPINLVDIKTDVPQIPTVPSTVQKLMGEIEKLQLDQLVASAHKLIVDADDLINSPDAKAAIPELRKLIGNTSALVNGLDAEVKPLVASLRKAADSATGAFDEGKVALANLDQDLKPAVSDIRRLVRQVEATLPGTMKRLDSALASAGSALDSVDGTIRPESRTMKDLRKALVEFAAASRAVRNLANELERNPSILIRGK